MIMMMLEGGTVPRQRRRACFTLSVAAGLLIVLFAAGWVGGLRINTTPSEPLGLWRIVPLNRSVRSGKRFSCARLTILLRARRGSADISVRDFAPVGSDR